MDVKVPNLGEGAESGTVVSILVKEGDQITKGQTILELENEKAVAPIPAPVSGTVTKIRVREGDKISVGQLILVVDTNGAEARPAKEQEAVAPAARPEKSGPVEHEEEDDLAAE